MLSLEIVKGRSLIWYFGIAGAILVTARSFVANDPTDYDPSEILTGFAEHSHFCPTLWREEPYSVKVRREFASLFQFRIVSLLMELVSVIVVPFILWFPLAESAGSIVDFFREFTVHVDGIGYVCSFGIFDFKKHGNPQV